MDLPLSKHLLFEDSLLTPRLKSNFGKITAFESDISESIETESTYLRESILYQESTGNKILEATLRVEKNNLPKGLIRDLRKTSVPFGDLLKQYSVSTKIENLQMIFNTNLKSGVVRMGRRNCIMDLTTNKVICNVYELLVSEEELSLAKKEYKNIN